MKRVFIIFLISICHIQLCAQIYPLNSFFTVNADYSGISDTNNFLLDEVTSVAKFKQTMRGEFPYTIEQSERASQVIVIDTIIKLHGLHAATPSYDSVLQEVKGIFLLDSLFGSWYAYRCKSNMDSSAAFLIIPGPGYHMGWTIATAMPNNYHNIPMPIRDKCLKHGDVYVYVKPNEDFRAIWKRVWNWNVKLDYDILGPYTDYQGINWAANMVVEATAAVKTLRKKYQKVFILGLSSAGLPALIAGIEGEAHGTVLACGLAVSDYEGFPVINNENPSYYRVHKKYGLDSVRHYLGNSGNYFLFGFGANDMLAFEEYQNRRLEDTLNSTGNTCHIDFTYNYSGHHYPIAYLDTFIRKVKIDSCSKALIHDTYVDKENKRIIIYPNPASDLVHVVSNGEKIQYVQVFNLYGQELKHGNYVSENKVTLSLADLSIGKYLIHVVGESTRTCFLVSKIE